MSAAGRERALDVPEEMLRRLERDVKKGAFKYLTPHTLSQAYEIDMSTARKLLRLAHQRGLLDLYAGGRRAKIYTPKQEGQR